MFDGLVEWYGLQIIPDANLFLVLPNSILRSMAVGAILHSGGPERSGVCSGLAGPCLEWPVGAGAVDGDGVVMRTCTTDPGLSKRTY